MEIIFTYSGNSKILHQKHEKWKRKTKFKPKFKNEKSSLQKEYQTTKQEIIFNYTVII